MIELIIDYLQEKSSVRQKAGLVDKCVDCFPPTARFVSQGVEIEHEIDLSYLKTSLAKELVPKPLKITEESNITSNSLKGIAGKKLSCLSLPNTSCKIDKESNRRASW